jgi:hypothetical protein
VAAWGVGLHVSGCTIGDSSGSAGVALEFVGDRADLAADGVDDAIDVAHACNEFVSAQADGLLGVGTSHSLVTEGGHQAVHVHSDVLVADKVQDFMGAAFLATVGIASRVAAQDRCGQDKC